MPFQVLQQKGQFMRVFITGAAGRLGRILRAAWAQGGPLGFEPIWSARKPDAPDDIAWDIVSDPSPNLGRGSIILHLAGVLRGHPASLSENEAMALKVCAAAKSAGARHVFLASSASVYGPSSLDHVEVQAPAPFTDYGRAKLAMERAALCWAHGTGLEAPGVTCLRIGNVLGADALFGVETAGRDIVLDSVVGQQRGPERSYIGPNAFAKVLACLAAQTLNGATMPMIMNVAAPRTVFMADLLTAARTEFRFGPINCKVIPKVSLATTKLSRLMALSSTDAAAMVSDWQRLSAYVS
jgi:nucleoside-diphosphate-sugar epimerase